ncbi:tyrosine-type recombinase/integrase [Rufibacter glacialis]|uniref:Tyrosine-type recombinase/integrase n=1 Tax=Rufibacter glacialis TaxID=1259555 RepID=A0A5M8QQI5_9BACT|nr:tyrosine-type recombinase/integrase [Rufibacter glacialis]KAA6437501.1 tyrosine-type recombinase/integrase [Rufibacter glacialis]GGK58828.1 integrase [Rufibacter glacialis]
METRFYLHTKVNKNGEQAIYAEIRSPWLRDSSSDRHELRMSTGYSCLAEHFSKEGQKVGTKQKDAKVINNHLRRFELVVGQQLEIARVNRTPVSPTELKQSVLADIAPEKLIAKDKSKTGATGKVMERKPVTFRDWYEIWAKNNRTELSDKHIRHGARVLEHLEAFYGSPFTAEKITEEFIADYRDYLAEEEEIFDSTANKHIGFIRSVLAQAGISTSGKWLKIKRTRGSRGIVFTKEEQTLIRAFNPEQMPKEQLMTLPKKDGAKPKELRAQNERTRRETLALARDLMLFMFKTGPRHSDLKNLEKSDLHTFDLPDGRQIKVLEYYQIKNGKRRQDPCRVALDEEALAIIERYADRSSKLLPVPSNQKLNDALKEVCRLAGVNSPIKRVRYRKGERVEVMFEKWEVAACHRCRATCATNLFEGGADDRTVQDVLGHEDPRSTQVYVRNADREQFAKTLAAFERLGQK